MRLMARGAALLTLLFLATAPASFSLFGRTEEPPAAPSPAAKEPTELRLPPDLEYRGGADGPGVAVFRHTTHAALAENNCLACHNPPAPIFKILHPVRRTSHEEMSAGKTCGACHDGKKAFGTTETENCQLCHSATAEPAASPAESPAATGAPAQAPVAAKPVAGGNAGGQEIAKAAPAAPVALAATATPRTGPRDVKLARSEGSPGAVTFRHSSHGGATAKCTRCHPSLFPMKASGKPLDYQTMLQGATCGKCHDGKEAFGVDDSERCERCHAAEGPTP